MTLRPRSRTETETETVPWPALAWAGTPIRGQPAIFMAPNCTALPSPVPLSSTLPVPPTQTRRIRPGLGCYNHKIAFVAYKPVILLPCDSPPMFPVGCLVPAPPPPPRALCLLLLHFAQMKNVAVYFHLECFYCGGGGSSSSSDGALNIICCINVGHMHMKIGNTQRTNTHIYIHKDLTHTWHIHSFCLISM